MAPLTRNRRLGWPALAALIAAVAMLGARQAADGAETSKAIQVEAAFVFNFAKFVEWPDSAFGSPSAPLVIGVLGDGPILDALTEVVHGESARGRPLTVRSGAKLGDLLDCHILVVAKPRGSSAVDIIREVGARPILTVSDIEGFDQCGGIIQFYLDGTKLRFLINPPAAQGANLKLSAQLLSVGKLVGGVDDPGTKP